MEPPAEPQLAPYVIEGARSSRSRCKSCRRKIDKGTLRIGVLIEGPYGTGYLWNHLSCLARTRLDQVEEAYAQQAWNEAKELPVKLPSLDELRKLAEEGARRREQRKTLPYAEIDPSGRAKCKGCGGPLERGAVRFVLGRAVEFGNQVRTAPVLLHPRCVAAELAQDDRGTDADGFHRAVRDHSEDLVGELLDAALAEIDAAGLR
ncbi:MAG TPA: hypothetical protein VD788_11925 [Candidatus Polarisedimenticolaceae bacterium]|nr:hypothetical protein [Candidatus Polarisedimenticolaceae bacterium]